MHCQVFSRLPGPSLPEARSTHTAPTRCQPKLSADIASVPYGQKPTPTLGMNGSQSTFTPPDLSHTTFPPHFTGRERVSLCPTSEPRGAATSPKQQPLGLACSHRSTSQGAPPLPQNPLTLSTSPAAWLLLREARAVQVQPRGPRVWHPRPVVGAQPGQGRTPSPQNILVKWRPVFKDLEWEEGFTPLPQG